MTSTIFSSREFNQATSRAKKAAKSGPVFITDRGRTEHVLLSIEEYKKLKGPQLSVADALAMDGDVDFEVEFPRSRELARGWDFS